MLPDLELRCDPLDKYACGRYFETLHKAHYTLRNHAMTLITLRFALNTPHCFALALLGPARGRRWPSRRSLSRSPSARRAAPAPAQPPRGARQPRECGRFREKTPRQRCIRHPPSAKNGLCFPQRVQKVSYSKHPNPDTPGGRDVLLYAERATFYNPHPHKSGVVVYAFLNASNKCRIPSILIWTLLEAETSYSTPKGLLSITPTHTRAGCRGASASFGCG